MAVRSFRKVHTTNQDLNLIQDNLKEVLDGIISNPVLQAKPVGPIILGTGTNIVSHGLGRAYQGCLVGIPSSVVSLSLGTSPDASQFIAIVASGHAVVTIYPY